jgi:hypothetical protein
MSGPAQLALSDDSTDPVPGEQEKLEAEFERNLSGSVLVGHFTIVGEDNNDLKEEKYTIRKVVKVTDKEDVWRFFVRIQYGKFDVTLPLDLQVVWAGDTPVITLTDYKIPALGTFSARVLIRDDLYAGTWQHGKLGGHLFGKVTRGEEEPGEAATKQESRQTEE